MSTFFSRVCLHSSNLRFFNGDLIGSTGDGELKKDEKFSNGCKNVSINHKQGNSDDKLLDCKTE